MLQRRASMPFVDTSSLEVIERLPGWSGRYFQSPSMTFAHYDFTRGASIHEHFHPQEEVYEVIELVAIIARGTLSFSSSTSRTVSASSDRCALISSRVEENPCDVKITAEDVRW